MNILYDHYYIFRIVELQFMEVLTTMVNYQQLGKYRVMGVIFMHFKCTFSISNSNYGWLCVFIFVLSLSTAFSFAVCHSFSLNPKSWLSRSSRLMSAFLLWTSSQSFSTYILYVTEVLTHMKLEVTIQNGSSLLGQYSTFESKTLRLQDCKIRFN